MTTDTTTRYTCTLELDIYDNADIERIELLIERALDNLDEVYDSVDNIRAGNLYKENN